MDRSKIELYAAGGADMRRQTSISIGWMHHCHRLFIEGTFANSRHGIPTPKFDPREAITNTNRVKEA